MKIYNKYFKLEVIDNIIFYNLKKIDYIDYRDLYDKMLKYISRKKTDDLNLIGEFESLNNIEQVILLVLSNFYRKVYSVNYKKDLDITFSYNFPINYQKWIINRILDIPDISFNNNMVALGDSVDYIEVDVSNEKSYELFYKKYGRLMRKGDKEFEVRINDLKDTLDYWNNYCKDKHNKVFSNDALCVYKDIYSTFNFYSIKLLYKNEIMVETVYFKDVINKTLYFCILGWDSKYKNLSPGIYTYAKGIEYCHNNNYKFSFCYGLQDYKKEMLSFFGEAYE